MKLQTRAHFVTGRGADTDTDHARKREAGEKHECGREGDTCAWLNDPRRRRRAADDVRHDARVRKIQGDRATSKKGRGTQREGEGGGRAFGGANMPAPPPRHGPPSVRHHQPSPLPPLRRETNGANHPAERPTVPTILTVLTRPQKQQRHGPHQPSPLLPGRRQTNGRDHPHRAHSAAAIFANL